MTKIYAIDNFKTERENGTDYVEFDVGGVHFKLNAEQSLTAGGFDIGYNNGVYGGTARWFTLIPPAIVRYGVFWSTCGNGPSFHLGYTLFDMENGNKILGPTKYIKNFDFGYPSQERDFSQFGPDSFPMFHRWVGNGPYEFWMYTQFTFNPATGVITVKSSQPKP